MNLPPKLDRDCLHRPPDAAALPLLWTGFFPLLDDPKGKMGDIRGIYSTGLFEVNELAADMIKQAQTFTEQYRHEVNL